MTADPPALAGLDDVAWASFDHAYGPATDVPDLLRDLASGDEEAAAAAVDELYSCIWHQGSVYPATVPAVPFLVKVAASGAAGDQQTPEVLRLLGHIAASSDPRGLEAPDAARSTVAAHAEAITGLLNHPDAKTRAAAMFVLVHASAENARALAIERWHAESAALPRAEALHALLRLDPDAAADLADGVLSAVALLDGAEAADTAVLRASAALAWIHAGRTPDERTVNAALTPLPTDAGLWHWNDEAELFDQLMATLAARQGTQAATDLLTEALNRAHHAPPALAEQYLATARQLIVTSRSAPATLAQPIARLLDRPDLATRAITLLELIGPDVAGPVARARLAELAGAGLADAADPAATAAPAGPDAASPAAPAGPDAFASPDPACAGADLAAVAEEALTCLAHWHDPIVPDVLSRTLADRPRVLEVVAASAATLPFHPGLLAAIRRRLTELCDAAHDQPAASNNPFAAVQNRSEPSHLAKILTAWGNQAAPAAPELVRLLATRPTVAAPALAAIRPPSLEGMATLRRIAATAADHDAVRARLAAAQAIRTLTQDPGPLLDAIHFGLTAPTKSPDDRAAAAEAAAELADLFDASDLADTLAAAELADPSAAAESADLPGRLVAPDRPASDPADTFAAHPAAVEPADLPAARDPLAAPDRPTTEAAATLTPHLHQALQSIPVPTPSIPAHQARMQLARALWRLTGRPEPALDVLRGTLALAGEMFTAWTVAAAADLAAELGPAARGLAPALEAALADPNSCPAAAQALLTVDPDGPWSGPRRAELADHLLHALAEGRLPAARTRALDVLTALAPLPPSTAEKLRAFAERDERVPLAVQDAEGMRNDDQLRTRISALLQN